MPPPRRSSLMSYTPSSRRNSSNKIHSVGFDEAECHLSGPPLELMDRISGYEDVSFDSTCVPPPAESRCCIDEGQESNTPVVDRPSLTEQEAREALLTHIGKHSCYGRDTANSHLITSLEASSAFHYQLETFTERRENSWAHTAFSTMTEIDGPDNGPAPLPWDIAVSPRGMFEAEVKTLWVPHTSSVKHCFRCNSQGSVACQECHSKGWVRCLHCNGDGFTSEFDYKERCVFCRSSTHGFGRLDCLRCKASGRILCQPCEGTGLMIYYILLTITWKTNISEYIKKSVSLPEKFFRFVTGEEVFSQIGERIKPLTEFPQEEVNEASKNLINNHISTFVDQKILMQRQTVRAVPITHVRYKWKGHEGQYFVFGEENRVHAPDYPQTCCWGCICTIL
ncbi:protein SSUH2 homolog isoform X2 [Macrosteles quadrilineatus]|uniref:protein SSUH2 homolog isoform X2 n=2 Tax=Macrosteles quadrilineatus TaxID=74068 RepID=UPI0023E1E910|nr:protein SSUH2 homolog isoform X2 [Macrosteles quadrilineatus]